MIPDGGRELRGTQPQRLADVFGCDVDVGLDGVVDGVDNWADKQLADLTNEVEE